MSRSTVTGTAAALLAVSLWLGAPAGAQTIYQWVDERGVVHFEQAPPRRAGGDVRTRQVRPGTGPATTEDARSSSREEGDNGDAEAELYGVADLRVRKKKISRIGPSGREVKGRVKNRGNGVAHNVTVTIVVIDTDQNGPCFEQTAEVEPSELGPGQEGKFLAELEHPCLYGNTKIRVRPEWD